jgi:hypothetical protein
MKSIFRFIENVWNRIVKVPEKQKKPALPIDTYCSVCNWSGNNVYTMIDDSNDSCPRCGNTFLDYII